MGRPGSLGGGGGRGGEQSSHSILCTACWSMALCSAADMHWWWSAAFQLCATTAPLMCPISLPCPIPCRRLLADSAPLFQRNTIRDEVHGVVALEQSAGGRFEKNDIQSCLIANVQIKTAGPQLVFMENNITDAIGPGVIILGGTPLFVGNVVRGNASTGNAFALWSGMRVE